MGIQDAVMVLNLAKTEEAKQFKEVEEKKQEEDGFLNGDGWVDGVVRSKT